MNILRGYYGLIVVLVLSIFSILPFFNNGFFPIHDDTQVARVFEMGKALKDGIFPVRWVPDLGYGYGYPIFNFYAPLAYYVGGFFNVLGFDALVSTKIMMILGIILSGLFMYFLAREFWGEMGGIISGLFYIYAPYHAVDIYVRGDVAEFYAYAFIPLMFLGFYKVSQISNLKSQISKLQFKTQNLFKWIIIGSVGYAGVILSHNLTAMMVTPFVIIVILLYLPAMLRKAMQAGCYIAYRNKSYSSMFYVLCSMFLGLVLSAFYWLPALMEMKYTNVMSQIGGEADFRGHFVCARQLWNSEWGFGGSIKGCIDGMSFNLGKIHILFSVISLILISIVSLKNKLFILLSIFGLLISTFLMLEVSKPVWESIPLMAFFQYPWRFLIMTSFFMSFLAGSVIWFLHLVIASEAKQSQWDCFVVLLSRTPRNDGKRVLSCFIFGILIFLLIFLNAKLFNPQTIIPKTAADYVNEYALKWEASRISDEYLPKDFVKPKSFSEIQKGKINLRNYPEQSFIQKLSNFLSLAGALMLILGIIYTRKKKINGKTIG